MLGAAVEAFGGLHARDRAARGHRAASDLGERARERLLGAVCAGERARACSPPAARRARVRARARGASSPSSRRGAWSPGASPPRCAAWAPAIARALRRGARAPLRRLPAPRSSGSGCSTPSSPRRARSTRCGSRPSGGGARRSSCYGFDDLEPLQLDAIETLAHARRRAGRCCRCRASRAASRSPAARRTLETLRPGAERGDRARAARRATTRTPALHHLERTLFEDAPDVRDRPGARCALLEGGDERAEAELVAAEHRRADRRGLPRRRDRGRHARATRRLIAQALERRGVPFAARPARALRRHRARRRAGRAAARRPTATRRPRALAAHARGRRSHGARRPLRGDAAPRGRDATSTRRGRGGSEHWPLDALDRLRDARARPCSTAPSASSTRCSRRPCAARRRCVDRVAGRRRRRGPAHARGAARARRGRPRPGCRRRPSSPARSRTRSSSCPAPTATARSASSTRSRCARGGCARSSSPACRRGRSRRARAPEPFLTAAERAEIARASGLVLGGMGDAAAAERYLFYALCSRPTGWLRVSWHDSSDADAPALRSLFVDDLADCFDAGLLEARTIRAAGARSRRARAPSSTQPRRRGPVIGPPGDPRALDALRARAAYSPSALEQWVQCPVAWFVERGLGAKDLEPPGVPQARGSAAHEALRARLRRPARAHRQRAPGRREPAARARAAVRRARRTAHRGRRRRSTRRPRRRRPAPLPALRRAVRRRHRTSRASSSSSFGLEEGRRSRR